MKKSTFRIKRNSMFNMLFDVVQYDYRFVRYNMIASGITLEEAQEFFIDQTTEAMGVI
jgi:hypothetical protein